jgi:hypothetical protein
VLIVNVFPKGGSREEGGGRQGAPSSASTSTRSSTTRFGRPSSKTGDTAAFARSHVAWLRGYSENVLFSVLMPTGVPNRGCCIRGRTQSGGSAA